MEIQTAGERGFLMDTLHRFLYSLFYKPLLKLYLKTDSAVSFDGFKLKILKGVFHPRLFFSTRYFYSFILGLELKGIRFLEIGSGSGLLSLLAYRKGALVWAIDIDEKAVETTQTNFRENFQNLSHATVLKSDLFSDLAKQVFDVVVINPPYYFKKVDEPAHYAWYCGENGEYFQKLFSGLAGYITARTATYMVLADNCDIDRIRDIAQANNFALTLVTQKKIKWETNYIFKITESHSIITGPQ